MKIIPTKVITGNVQPPKGNSGTSKPKGGCGCGK